jgi:hypothetical protein
MPSETDQDIHECSCSICQAQTDPVLMQYHRQINVFLHCLSEPQRRWYVATLADAPDAPSVRQLSVITGLSRDTIRRGQRELASGTDEVLAGRQRRAGGGRPTTQKKTPPSKP